MLNLIKQEQSFKGPWKYMFLLHLHGLISTEASVSCQNGM